MRLSEIEKGKYYADGWGTVRKVLQISETRVASYRMIRYRLIRKVKGYNTQTVGDRYTCSLKQFAGWASMSLTHWEAEGSADGEVRGTVKVVSDGPVETKRVLCRGCGYELEYRSADMEMDTVVDPTVYGHGDQTPSYWIRCPRGACGFRNEVKGRIGRGD